jgi:hypothetical protein
VERVGSLRRRTPPAPHQWYGSLALFNTLKLARLTGVRP